MTLSSKIKVTYSTEPFESESSGQGQSADLSVIVYEGAASKISTLFDTSCEGNSAHKNANLNTVFPKLKSTRKSD